MHISSLRQPGYPFYFWTRGFASPDYSGFARSENVVSTILATNVLLPNFPKKKQHFFYLVKCHPILTIFRASLTVPFALLIELIY